MNPIPEKFRSDRFDFQLLRRQGDVALFSKQKPQHSRPTFEVVVIQRRPAERIFGRNLPNREVMLSNESWGALGWSFSDFASAKARFDQLCQAQRKGHFPSKGIARGASKGSRSPKAPSKA
jgi:hypothetical protein